MRRTWAVLGVGVAVAAGAVAVERSTVTCGERLPELSPPAGAVPLAQLASGGSPADRERRAGTLRAAGAVRPETGVGALRWGAQAVTDPLEMIPSEVVSAGSAVVVRTDGELIALRARDGRGLWRRALPHGGADLEPLRNGVAVWTIQLDGWFRDRSQVTMLDERGQVVDCADLGGPPTGEDIDARTGTAAATDPRRGLVVAVGRDGDSSRVTLWRDGGREQVWEAETPGEWGAVAVAGDTVVVGDAGRDPEDRALVGLRLADGRPLWSVPRSVADRVAPGAPDPSRAGRARIAWLRAGGGRLLAAGERSLPIEGRLPGRTLAVDARSGRVVWTGASVTRGGPLTELEPAGDLLLAVGSFFPVLAVDVATGRPRWKAPGSEDLVRRGERILFLGNTPTVASVADGRPRPLSRPVPGAFWDGLGGTEADGHVVIATASGLVLAFPMTETGTAHPDD